MGKKKKMQASRQDDQHKREISDDAFESWMGDESFTAVRSLKIGEQVKGTVIGSNKESIFLDLGSRLDGILRRYHLTEKENRELAEGQIITVYISGRGKGVWLCSTRESGEPDSEDPKRSAALLALEDAFNRNEPVEGKVTSVSKGGFEVQVTGLKAFCPISQIDKHYCDSPDAHLDKTYHFVIIEFKEDGPNIVLSRREHLQHEERKRQEKLWQQVEEDAVYEGIVTAVLDFGAFVDIGGIDGLLHVSEISHARIGSVADVLKVGQQVDVIVKSVDRQKRKLSLSAKALLEDPWIAALKKLKVGGEYQGKVVRMKTFGAFVELFPGVDGMVHISRLGTDRRHQHPKEVLKLDDMVTVRILEIDKENKRISLTMEQEDGDFSQDLKRLKKEQDKEVKSTPSQMSSVFDKALKKDED